MEKLLAWLPERPQPLIVRYGTTAIIVAICFAVLRLVQLQSGVDSFFLMYPAVLLGALLFDRGSGFFAALLSTVLIVIFLPRQGGVIIPPSYWSPVTLFLLIGLALAALSEALRKDGSARSKPNAPRTCFTESCGIARRTISPWLSPSSICKPVPRSS
jgi:two-component system, sensor histidine kinase PdtaS